MIRVQLIVIFLLLSLHKHPLLSLTILFKNKPETSSTAKAKTKQGWVCFFLLLKESFTK